MVATFRNTIGIIEKAKTSYKRTVAKYDTVAIYEATGVLCFCFLVLEIFSVLFGFSNIVSIGILCANISVFLLFLIDVLITHNPYWIHNYALIKEDDNNRVSSEEFIELYDKFKNLLNKDDLVLQEEIKKTIPEIELEYDIVVNDENRYCAKREIYNKMKSAYECTLIKVYNSEQLY